MLTQLMPLATALVAQAGSSATSPITLIVAAAFIAAAVGCFMLYSRLGALQTQIDEVQTKLTTKDQELRETTSREKEVRKELTEKNEAYTKLKHDLAGQKKKLHTANEEAKSLKKAHKEEVDKLQRRVSTKPAFQEAAKVEVKTKPADTKAEAPSETKSEAAPEPASANTEELEALRATNQKLKTRLEENKQYISKAKREVKDSRFRVERYRRIDIITRNRTELLEDKLLTLGRDHYDVISEMAVLKGEVQPPRPRELIEAEKRAEQARLEAEAKAKEQDEGDDDAPVTLELDAELESTMAPEELELVDEATEDGDEAVELDAAQVVTEGAEAPSAQPSA